MAGTLVSDYGVGDVDLTALMDTVTKQRVDFEAVTLTNHDNDSLPAIAAGSMLNVNGALYQFSSEESISGSASAGLNYIKFVVSGGSCTPTWTDSAPTWSDAKQGWYNSNDRYLFTCDYDGSSVYSNKMKLLGEQWPDFLKPSLIARQTKDIELDGTAVTQRVIYCRNFHVTANTTLKARTVWVEGDFTIDAGVTLTIEPLELNTYGGSHYLNFMVARPGEGHATARDGGCGGFGGQDGARNSSGQGGGGGGFGTGGTGGSGTAYPASGGTSNGIAIANGGSTTDLYLGGGGATCAGGGNASTSSNSPGRGGEVTFFIVRGNFINNGTITNNGTNGGIGDGRGHGGGGAGITGIFCFGDTYTGGTINCIGGDGGNSTKDGGGGAGGGIFEVGKTSTFATKDVSGGAGGTNANAGGTGVTETYNISDGTTEFFCSDGDPDAILPKIMKLIEGRVA